MSRLFAILIVSTTLLVCVGCAKNLRCERETALLRAEILDLEDKYYALQAQQRAPSASGMRLSSGGVIGNGTVGQGVIVDGYAQSPMIQPPIQNEIIYGDVIYEGESYPAQSYPAYQYPMGSEYPMGSGVGYEDVTYGANGQPIIVSDETYYDGSIAPVESATADDGYFLDSNSSEAGSIPDEIIESPSIDQGELPARSDSDVVEPPVDSNSLDSVDGASLESEFERFSLEQASVEPDSPDASELEISFQEDKSEPLIAAIAINPNASRGEDIDGRPGDDGLNLLIETKTKLGEVVDGVGTVTVQVTDPTSINGSGVVGEWTFLPYETELFLSRDEFNQRGILLHLPWEDQIPQGSLIGVNVIFETSDGRKLRTSASMQITPPTASAPKADQNLVTGWTSRDRRWVTDPAHNLANENPASRGVNRSSSPRLIGPQPQPTQPHIQHQWQSNGRGNFTRSAVPVRSASPAPAAIQPPEWKPVR